MMLGVPGWLTLTVFLLVVLILAWRMIAYANTSVDSPYVKDMLEHHPHSQDSHEE